MKVALFIVCIFLSYSLIQIYSISLKSKYVISNSSKFLIINNLKIYFNLDLKFKLNEYIKKVKYSLFIRDYPCRLSFKNYIFIKYFLSVYISVVITIFFKNVIISLVTFSVIFKVPNIVMYMFDKYEKFRVKEEISNIVQIILLRNKITNHEEKLKLKENINSKYINRLIKYKRLKKHFVDFGTEQGAALIREKFNNEYVTIFLDILNDDRKNDLEVNLKNFLEFMNS